MPITLRASRQGEQLFAHQEVARHHHTAQPVAQPQAQAPTSPHPNGTPYHQNNGTGYSSATRSADDTERPVKRRKLLIKGPRQQTLDSFAFTRDSAAAATPPRPTVQSHIEEDSHKKPSPPRAQTQLLAQLRDYNKEPINGATTLTHANVDTHALPRGFRGGSPRQDPSKPRRQRSPHAETAATSTTTFTNGIGEPPDPAKRSSRKEEKRSLRSHDEDKPRLKSELATYFPNYEEIMLDLESEPEFIEADSVLFVVEDEPQLEAKGKGKNSGRSSTAASPPKPVRRPPRPIDGGTAQDFNGCTPLDLGTLLPQNATSTGPIVDLLTDQRYLISHRRRERKEKQLRNIEHSKAMHEKASLERILAGLQSHDWLKVLGITGVTDGESRKYEAKRDYFTTEVEALVGKFDRWKREEKRIRAERERERERAEEEETSSSSSDEDIEPTSSDLNAGAAKQLQQETLSALKGGGGGKRTPTPSRDKRDKARSGITLKLSRGNSNKASPVPPNNTTASNPANLKAAPLLPPAPPPLSPITSFFSKPHLRAAALANAIFGTGKGGSGAANPPARQRTAGRNMLAFGVPLPPPLFAEREREFELPGEYLTRETLEARGRARRMKARARRSEGKGKD